MTAGGLGDDSGQGGFAGARRSPEDGGSELVLLNQSAQNAVFTKQVLLTDHFIKTVRTQSLSEWRRCFV